MCVTTITTARVRRSHHGAPRLANRRGVTAVLIAVLLVPLISLLGLAVDLGMLYRERRTAQTAADVAAIAGANELYRGMSVDSAAAAVQREATRNGFTHGGVTSVMYRTAGPSSGPRINNAKFVEVVVSRDVPTLFAGIFGRNAVTVRGRGVAGSSAASTNCVYVLNATAGPSLSLQNAAHLNLGCNVVVNSSNAGAVNIIQTARVTTSSLSVTGTLTSGSSTRVTGTVVTGVPPSPAPLADVTLPPAGTCTSATTNVTASGSSTVNLVAGTYCGGILARNASTIRFGPGVYHLLGGTMQAQNSAKLISDSTPGVTFILRQDAGGSWATVDFGNNAATTTLYAPTTGDLAGILFYKSAAAPAGTVNLANAGLMTLRGALYFPSQTLAFNNASDMTFRGVLVADQITMRNSGGLSVAAPPSGTTSPYNPIKRVSLVE